MSLLDPLPQSFPVPGPHRLSPTLMSYVPPRLKTAIRLLADLAGYEGAFDWGGIVKPWKKSNLTDREWVAMTWYGLGRSTLGWAGAYCLYQFAKQVRSLPGEVAEVGVYQGGSARILIETFKPVKKMVHLFDTFNGHPAPDPMRDRHRQGGLADTSVAYVQSLLADVLACTTFHPGLFPHTAGSVAAQTFCFVHGHGDLYATSRAVCEFFYPRLVPGGIMVFSDYGSVGTPGARHAVEEFFARRPESPCYLPTGQAVVVKLPGSSCPR